MPLMPVGLSVQRGRTVHRGLSPAIVRQAFVRRSFRSFAGWDAVPLTLANYEYSSIGQYAVVGSKLQAAVLGLC